MKLPYAIAIAGLACALFAMSIPHLSALRIWLAFSTFFSLVYIIIGFALALKDGILSSFSCLHFVTQYVPKPVPGAEYILILWWGNHSFAIGTEAPPRDYEIPGSVTDKIFTTIGASANLVFAFNTGMLPEIQVRLKINEELSIWIARVMNSRAF